MEESTSDHVTGLINSVCVYLLHISIHTSRIPLIHSLRIRSTSGSYDVIVREDHMVKILRVDLWMKGCVRWGILVCVWVGACLPRIFTLCMKFVYPYSLKGMTPTSADVLTTALWYFQYFLIKFKLLSYSASLGELFDFNRMNFI